MEEISDDEIKSGHLGESEEGSIPIIGCIMDISHMASSNLYLLRITNRSHSIALEVGANTLEEAQQWKDAIEAANKKATTAVRLPK